MSSDSKGTRQELLTAWCEAADKVNGLISRFQSGGFPDVTGEERKELVKRLQSAADEIDTERPRLR